MKAVYLFRSKNDKIKLKEANSFSDHARLYEAWISEQQKKGGVFKYRSHGPLPWDIRPKINLGKINVDSILRLHKK
jgi:gamma-glutamyl:cysteine ligase YbdK (ATP-grasp superfamily)